MLALTSGRTAEHFLLRATAAYSLGRAGTARRSRLGMVNVLHDSDRSTRSHDASVETASTLPSASRIGTTVITVKDVKRMAARLQKDLSASGSSIGHSAALELVARQLGHRDWNTARATLDASSSRAGLKTARPILRITDQRAAYDFYLGFLGFRLDWEHRFEPGLPLYAQVRRDGCVLHLSEHFGDGTPGTAVWIPVVDVRALHGELIAAAYRFARPGVDETAPGGPTLELTDPFGNVLRFAESDEGPGEE